MHIIIFIMKNKIKKIITIFVKICHTMISLSTVNYIRSQWYKVYSIWISFEFKGCGKNFRSEGFYKLNGAKNITIGDNVIMGHNIVLETNSSYGEQTFSPIISIGNNTSFQDDCHITCINKIIIGNSVRVGRKCLFSDNAHGASDISLMDMDPLRRPLTSKGPIVIEDNVWVGEMCCVMPGVTIGRGSIIGANAVVTKDVPPYSVVVGPAGKIIKTLK